MADVVVRQHYAGDVQPVELKQGIQEAPVAHPERVEARSEVRGATERWVDVPSKHGGADRRWWRCSESCGGQNEKSMGHGGLQHCGEAETRLSRGRGSP